MLNHLFTEFFLCLSLIVIAGVIHLYQTGKIFKSVTIDKEIDFCLISDFAACFIIFCCLLGAAIFSYLDLGNVYDASTLNYFKFRLGVTILALIVTNNFLNSPNKKLKIVTQFGLVLALFYFLVKTYVV